MFVTCTSFVDPVLVFFRNSCLGSEPITWSRRGVDVGVGVRIGWDGSCVISVFCVIFVFCVISVFCGFVVGGKRDETCSICT